MIESNWRARTEGNPRIFDASKFRLAGIEFGENSKKLGLRVGLTSYKELLGTHYSHVTRELQSEAKATFVRASSSTGGISQFRLEIKCFELLNKVNTSVGKLWEFEISKGVT